VACRGAAAVSAGLRWDKATRGWDQDARAACISEWGLLGSRSSFSSSEARGLTSLRRLGSGAAGPWLRVATTACTYTQADPRADEQTVAGPPEGALGPGVVMPRRTNIKRAEDIPAHPEGASREHLLSTPKGTVKMNVVIADRDSKANWVQSRRLRL